MNINVYGFIERTKMDAAEMSEMVAAERLISEAKTLPLDPIIHRMGRTARAAGEALVRLGDRLDRPATAAEVGTLNNAGLATK